MTIGGKVIDSGGFGCVFRPQIRCKKSRNNKNKIYGDNKYDENGISKVMPKKYAINEYNELVKFISIIKMIPNYNHYFIISQITLCRPQYFKPSDLIDLDKIKCSSLKKKNITSKNINSKLKKMYMINMPYGGIDINKFLRKNITDIKLMYNFNIKMIDLLDKAILPMNKKGLYHGDLKSNNILVSVENNKKMYVRIIDWGLSGIYLQNDLLKTLITESGFENEWKEIPDVFRNRPFQFNVPFSNILFSRNFNKEYNNYLSIPDKDKYSLYEFVKRFINNYIDSSSGHLRNFNSIFNKIRTIMSYISNTEVATLSIKLDNYEKIFINNIKYIYDYLYKILEKYTRNNKFDVIDYFSNVYIKNLDVWGFIISYYDLIDYPRYNMYYNIEYNNSIKELIKKLLNLLLKYSTEPINIDELKKILHEFSNDIIKINFVK
jgi:hypothetical protein